MEGCPQEPPSPPTCPEFPNISGGPSPPPPSQHYQTLGSLEKVLLKLSFCSYKVRMKVGTGPVLWAPCS